ncbi:hypothetical protein [Streptomyces sp. NPDC058671]|uniref:hypothetical protein n=1 Tax=Streptomyces sp. NPDC058671 TaxID=3346590 RepID=UPI00365619EA
MAVTFRNSGGTAARSGTVTFATHAIGAPGVDWATPTSARPPPVPIAAGAARGPVGTAPPVEEGWAGSA